MVGTRYVFYFSRMICVQVLPQFYRLGCSNEERNCAAVSMRQQDFSLERPQMSSVFGVMALYLPYNCEMNGSMFSEMGGTGYDLLLSIGGGTFEAAGEV